MAFRQGGKQRCRTDSTQLFPCLLLPGLRTWPATVEFGRSSREVAGCPGRKVFFALQFTAGCDPGKTGAAERVGGGAATAAGMVQAAAELLLAAAEQPQLQAHAGLRISRAEMRGHLQQISGSAGGVGFLCSSCEVGWVCRFPGLLGGSGVGLLPSRWDSLTGHSCGSREGMEAVALRPPRPSLSTCRESTEEVLMLK